MEARAEPEVDLALMVMEQASSIFFWQERVTAFNRQIKTRDEQIDILMEQIAAAKAENRRVCRDLRCELDRMWQAGERNDKELRRVIESKDKEISKYQDHLRQVINKHRDRLAASSPATRATPRRSWRNSRPRPSHPRHGPGNRAPP